MAFLLLMLIPFFHVLSNSVDEEGFEIISTGPSKLELDKINSNYLKSIKKIFLTKCLTGLDPLMWRT